MGGAARLEVLDENGQVVDTHLVNNKTTKAGVEHIMSAIFGNLNNSSYSPIFRDNAFFLGVYDSDGQRMGSITNTTQLTDSRFMGGGTNKSDIIEANGRKYQYRYRTAVFSFGSIVGNVKSISVHSSTSSSRLTIAELPNAVPVTNTQQLRVTYYRMFDITDYLTNDNNIKDLELSGLPSGVTGTWNPFLVHTSGIYLAFLRYRPANNRGVRAEIWENGTKVVSGINAAGRDSPVRSEWIDDVFHKEMDLIIRLTPSTANHEDMEIDRIEFTSSTSYGHPLNIYFDEPIVKTGNDAMDLSVTLAVSCTNDQTFTPQEIDNILDAIHGD